MLMMSISRKELENDVPRQLRGESNLDRRAQLVQRLFKFKNFYDHMNFSEQRLAIIKVIMELTGPSRSSIHAENRPRRNNRFEDNAIVFYDNE